MYTTIHNFTNISKTYKFTKQFPKLYTTLQHCFFLQNSIRLLHNFTQVYTTLHSSTKLYTTLQNFTTKYKTLQHLFFILVHKHIHNYTQPYTTLHYCTQVQDFPKQSTTQLYETLQMYTRLSTTLQILTKSYTTLQNFLQLFFLSKTIHKFTQQNIQNNANSANPCNNFTQHYTTWQRFTQLYRLVHELCNTIFFFKKQYLATLVQNNKEVQPFYNFRTLYTILQHYTQLYTTLQQCTTLYTTLHNSERSNVRQLFLQHFTQLLQAWTKLFKHWHNFPTFLNICQNYTKLYITLQNLTKLVQ